MLADDTSWFTDAGFGCKAILSQLKSVHLYITISQSERSNPKSYMPHKTLDCRAVM